MLTELRAGVWWYECTGVNAYLAADGDGVTVIDTGTPLDASNVEAAVRAAGFELADIEQILLTHYDFDHVGSLGKLSTDAPVYIGRADADFLTGERRPSLSGHKSLLQRLTGPFIPNIRSGRLTRVDDGDEIGGFKAYHTPGHTPGHTIYFHDELEAAFLGDIVIERGGGLRSSPWIISEDTDAVGRSIRDIAARLPEFEVAAVGHGTPFESHGSQRLGELADRT